jgi:hypothetical protein
MPRKIYDMLELPPLEKCYLDVHLVDIAFFEGKTVGKTPLQFLLLKEKNFTKLQSVQGVQERGEGGKNKTKSKKQKA